MWILETEILENVKNLKKRKFFDESSNSEGAYYFKDFKNKKFKNKNEFQLFEKEIDSVFFDLDENNLSNLVNQISEQNKNKFNENHKEKLSDGMIWHIRLGHPSLSYLKQLSKECNFLKGVKFDDSILNCDVCIRAKMTKLPFTEIRMKSNKPLHLVHVDTMGPISPSTYQTNKRFIISFIDDFSRLAVTYCMQNKSDAAACFKDFLKTVRNELGENIPVCFLRCDNAPELIKGEFSKICENEKISYDTVNPYTPEHNGVVERFNRKLAEKVRCLMIDSGLPTCLWHLAVAAATYLINRTPNRSIDYELPLEKFNPNSKTNYRKC